MGVSEWIIGGLFIAGFVGGVALIIYVGVAVVPREIVQARAQRAWERDFLRRLTVVADDQGQPNSPADAGSFDQELLADFQETLDAADRRLRGWGRRAPSLEFALTHVSDLCRLKPGVVRERLDVPETPDLRPTRDLIKRLRRHVAHAVPVQKRAETPTLQPAVDDSPDPNANETDGPEKTGDDGGAQMGPFVQYRREIGTALCGGWVLFWASAAVALGDPPKWTNAATLILLAGGFACLFGSAAAFGVLAALWRRRGKASTR